jgi:hypothetical protein
MVEAAGACPSIGAAEDRLVAMHCADPLDFASNQIGGCIPLDFDELVPTSGGTSAP